MAAGDVSPKESFAPRGTTGRKDDARRTGGQAATPTEVAAQAEDSASQVPAERRRVTGKNWKATDVSYEELRWHFLQVPTIEAASRKSILLTKREEAAGAVTSSGGKKAEENDSSPEQPASLAAPSPTSASSSQKDEEELKTEAPQVEHAPRRPRGESKGRGRRGPGRGAPREQSQDPELSPVSALRESAELREKRKEMLQGGADESDSSPEKPALAAPDPTDASSKDSEPEDSLKTEEIAEEAPALLSAAPPRREAEETPSTAEPSVSAPGPAPGSAPSQKGTKTEDPLKTEALTLEIPVTPGQSWRKMHISPCKERRRRPGSTSPKSSRNACVTGTAESRTKSLGAGDDSPKNHWKGSAQQPEEEAKKPRIKELRKQNAELEALSTKDTPTPPSASPKDQIWSRLHDMHRELDERRKELVEQKRREVQEQETEIRAKCRTFRQAQTSEVEAIASKLHGHKAEMEAKRQEALKEYEKRFESIHSFAPELSPKTRELAELKAVGATQTARIAQLYKDHHRRMAQRESQKEQLEVEELRILAEHSVHKNVSVKALESSQKLFEDAQKRAERLQQKCEAVLQKELEAFQKDCIHKAVASPPEFGERLHQEAKKRGVRLQRKRKEAENAMKAAARRCKSTPALGEGPSGQGFLQLYEDAQRREKTLSERRKKQLEDEQQELQNMQWVGPQASQALARASSPVEPVEPVPPASASGSRSVSASGRGRRSRSASPRPMSPKAASAQGPLGTSTKLKSSSVQELPSPRGRPREVSRETASSSRQPSRELPSTSRQIQVRPPSPRNPQITPSTEVTKNSRPASPEASQPRDVSMGRSAASAGASSSAPARRPQGPQGSQAQKGSTQRADRAQALLCHHGRVHLPCQEGEDE